MSQISKISLSGNFLACKYKDFLATALFYRTRPKSRYCNTCLRRNTCPIPYIFVCTDRSYLDLSVHKKNV